VLTEESGIRSWGYIPNTPQHAVRPQWKPSHCPEPVRGNTVLPYGNTMGGALANDVHGKNHHREGTFGCFITRFSLMRSEGQVLECSAQENSELFAATIGGLGLTGLVTELSIRLISVNSPYLDVRYDTFRGLEEFAALSVSRKSDYRYTVAWLDCASGGARFARGVFMSANHSTHPQDTTTVAQLNKVDTPSSSAFTFPVDLPQWILNSYSIRAFNTAYFNRYRLQHGKTVRQHYQPFFYPLDAINRWNRIYGADGFHQYQFVVPLKALDVMEKALKRIVQSPRLVVVSSGRILSRTRFCQSGS